MAVTDLSEADIMRTIQFELSKLGITLWRMNVGNFELADGRRITVGIPGMSDLLGITATGRFVAIECKRPGARTDPDRLKAQEMFIDNVKRRGGLGGFASSVSEAVEIVRG